MALKRAVVVDRDPAVLGRLVTELGRLGFLAETLDSAIGLTPDLLALGAPELAVFDAELPGLDPRALATVVAALKAQLAIDVVVTARNPDAALRVTGADRAVARARLLAEGVRALALAPDPAAVLDVRGILDEVLGRQTGPEVRVLSAALDLLSPHNFYTGRELGGPAVGVFVATGLLPGLGQPVELKLVLFGRHALETSGKVEWVRKRSALGGKLPTGVGVRLGALAEPDRAAVERFLATREPLIWTGG